tara:strand:+ start:59 stop:670 length:612 start_codon:yes stop_codon:yes gene_type:complete
MKNIKIHSPKSIYNIANFLSISRILAAIPLIISFQNMSLNHMDNYKILSIIIITYMIISDMLDGYLARISNIVTNFGKVIDPVADKVCFMVVLIYMITKVDNPQEYYGFIINPFLLFYCLLSIRDMILMAFYSYCVYKTGKVGQSNFYGKLFVFCSMLMTVFYIYDINANLELILYILSLSLMIISTYYYIVDIKKIINHEPI